MRSQYLLAVACLGLAAADASGQSLRQPAELLNVAYSDYYARDLGSVSVERLAAKPSSAAQIGSKGHSKGSDCACSDEPWRLFPEIGCGWTLTGWIEAGGTANGRRTVSRFNGPTTFNDRRRVQANQLYATFGRDVDTGGCGFDWGARVDVMFGSDFFFTQAAGLETHDDFSNHWNKGDNLYGLALPQFYGEVGYNDFRLKVGHFYTIIGYEVVTAPGNFFYSHAYTMQYGEPFTHTGGLLSWDVSDQLTLHGGLVNGWDNFDAESDRLAFLGGVNYTPCSERWSLAVGLISGEEVGAAVPVEGNRTMYSVVFTYNVTDNLEYVFQHDNAWQNRVAGANDEEWYGINQYLLYTLNDCWKVGARFEWFRDDDGARLTNTPLRNPPAGRNAADFAGNYYNITAGLNWLPNNNIVVRPEIRWDWSDGTVGAPFADGTKDSQFLGAIDAIVLY